ncbi:MAG: methyltransferase family protein [Anaerolineales bacterium]
MRTILRHFLSILFLPFVVLVVVPVLILIFRESGTGLWGIDSTLFWLGRISGGGLMMAGLILIGWCVYLFAQLGHGTLAPWDPPRHFVALGPYQYVRNPMIIGGGMMVFGEALFWGSWLLFIWACFFLVMNHFYFVFSEEPRLEQRFGQTYRLYKANVPRWIPRLKPWSEKQLGS